MIHITFEQPNIETLQKSFELDQTLQGEIIEIKDDYAMGYIKDIHTNKEHNSRLQWWKTILEFSPYTNTINSLNNNTTVQTLKEKLNQNPSQKVWIWVAQNQHDVCGYYYLIKQLKNYQHSIYLIYLNNLPFINEKRSIFYPTHLHHIQPKEFLKAKKLARLITPSEVEIDTEEWDNLCQQNAIIRILEGGKKIVSKQENFYDSHILNATTSEFQKLTKILHHTITKMPIQTSDTFLAWRVRELTQLKKLETKGDWSKGWREIEVKLAN